MLDLATAFLRVYKGLQSRQYDLIREDRYPEFKEINLTWTPSSQVSIAIYRTSVDYTIDWGDYNEAMAIIVQCQIIAKLVAGYLATYGLFQEPWDLATAVNESARLAALLAGTDNPEARNPEEAVEGNTFPDQPLKKRTWWAF